MPTTPGYLEKPRGKPVRSVKATTLRFITGQVSTPAELENVNRVDICGNLWSRVTQAMQERGVALGWRGVSAGMTVTYSWKEFFDMALAWGLVTRQEYRTLEEKYALIWKWDLHN